MTKGSFKRGGSHFCRVLGDAISERGTNPSQLHRQLVQSGFSISLDSIYKYCSGERRPSPKFVYWAARLLTDSADDERALAYALRQAHFGDVSLALEADFDGARDAIGPRANCAVSQ